MYAGEYDPGFNKTIIIISIICLVTSFLYNYYNAYAPMRTKRILYYICRFFLVNMGIVAFFVGLVLFLVESKEATGFWIRWIVSSMIFSSIALISKKTVMMSALHVLRHNRRNIKYVLLVTDSQEMADSYMEEILNNPHFGYSVIGYVGNLNVIGLPHLGTTGDLDRLLLEYQPDEVVLAFDTVRKKLITKYISICNNHCVKVMVVPAICGYFKSPRQVAVVGNLPIIDIRSTPLDSFANQFVKRVTDVIGSLLLIIITSPLMLFTAIGVRLSSPGPILFRQVRVGRHNKEFTMYKFRSMCVNGSEQTGWSSSGDPRITKFGAFIRKFALDELPQFFNVLKGDMSLVGPRPEVPYYVNVFKKQVPLYMLKHTLRPGITGLAQIKGLRGDTSIQARIDEDINYIENWTFWGDVRILLMTPFRAINRNEKYAKREQRDHERRLAHGGKQRRIEEAEGDHDEAD
jgi:Undecaprenyl-phosphate glucose phosphotransferase